MSGGRVVMVVAVAGLLSGCAGMRSRQELARLQSQVGLLDERVTQLERSTLGGGVSSSSLNEPAAEIGAPSGTSAPAPTRASTGAKEHSPSSMKPATRQIQQALKNAGFYQGSVDGKGGPMTKNAVKEFQRVHGLTDDGLVGRQTWAKLKAYSDLSAENGEANAAEALK